MAHFKDLFSRGFLAYLSLLVLLILAYGFFALRVLAADSRPNIVVLLIDDAALMDVGGYGGEARTPHIDSLMARGTFFTHFRTSPLCAPSRAMLLTGRDNHLAGMATIPEIIPDEHRGKPGYELHLAPGVRTIATHLQGAGYHTFMTGKWHLGHGGGNLPVDNGFDRSFILDASGADNWEQKSYIPYYADAPWFEDDAPARLPDDFYSSRFLVDKMISYLESRDSRAHTPFFAFVGFQAVHIPVQAPAELIAPYRDIYAQGWDVLRMRRHKKAIELGLIEAGSPPPRPHSEATDWTDLSPQEQTLYAGRMAVNAAMLEAMDIHIGRLIDHLRKTGVLDNTIFIVTSDNGPAPSDPVVDWRMRLWLKMNDYHLDNENIGERGSYAFIGPNWAKASAGHGAMFKFYASEGGVRVPLIVSGAGIPRGRVDSMGWASDIAPTILDWAAIDPQTLDGKKMTGRSLARLISGEVSAVYGRDEAIGLEVSGNSALYRGDYKITRNFPPFGDKQWRLYNLKSDPAETRDLKAIDPARFTAMRTAYDSFAKQVGALPMPDDYDSFAQLTRNALRKQIKENRGRLIGFASVATLLVFLGGFLFVRRYFFSRT